MADLLYEAGVVVECLQGSIRDGEAGLEHIPGLLKRIINERLWEKRLVTQTKREQQFQSFAEFVEFKAPYGLGTKVQTLKNLCRDEPDVRDAIDEACQNKSGRPPKTLDNIQGFPSGTSKDAGLRRLRKDRPDLHEQVISKQKTVHAAMVEAGFRRKTFTIPADNACKASLPKSYLRNFRR